MKPILPKTPGYYAFYDSLSEQVISVRVVPLDSFLRLEDRTLGVYMSEEAEPVDLVSAMSRGLFMGKLDIDMEAGDDK